jgi:protein eyes shut
LACLANPCKNGGTCEEKLVEQHDMENDINQGSMESIDSFENRWTCKCPTGYLGATCEKSVCENNPCHFGGTCVEFPGSGYLCLCPMGKHGHYCEHSKYKIDEYFVIRIYKIIVIIFQKNITFSSFLIPHQFRSRC